MKREDFLQLYNSQADSIARFLSYYVKEKNELEDLVQEVFLRIWKYKEKISVNHEYIKSYLLKTARNVALTHLERKKKNVLSQCEDLVAEPVDRYKEDEYAVKELNQHYNKALNEVPAKARTVYLMSREDGLSYKEIARNLEISPKTVEVHISKALKVLRQEFNRYEI
ncbi:MAG: RNA polymerase sigma-70 factor [Balneolales bacterium]|nr:RNA polymerase sigma-70 factor [Balneolales bacterium]